jgi:hypothetical protein
MARAVFAAALAVVAALTTGPAHLHACTCVVGGTACGSERSADAVFVGTVTSVELMTEPHVLTSRIVTLVVREPFKGVSSRVVEVGTGSGGGDCGFRFDVGSTYLVYAHRQQTTGLLTTGICSRTTHASRAPDLEWLRAQPAPDAPPGTLEGRVLRTRYQTAATRRPDEPMAGVQVRLMDTTRTWATTTSADGRYAFTVPQGPYQLHVDVPTGLYMETGPDAGGMPIRISDRDACRTFDIRTRPDGRVSGRLIDAQGRPVPYMSIDIAQRSMTEQPAYMFPEARVTTDAGGRFSFKRLPPEEYNVGFALRRYPGRAATSDDVAILLKANVPIDVGPEAHVAVGDVVVPAELAIHFITGRVVDAEGRPLAGASVTAETQGQGLGVASLPVPTDDAGQFQVSMLGGRRQVLIARQISEATGVPRRSEPLDPATVSGPVRLVIR